MGKYIASYSLRLFCKMWKRALFQWEENAKFQSAHYLVDPLSYLVNTRRKEAYLNIQPRVGVF